MLAAADIRRPPRTASFLSSRIPQEANSSVCLRRTKKRLTHHAARALRDTRRESLHPSVNHAIHPSYGLFVARSKAAMKIWAVEVSSASRECAAAVCSVLTNRTRHRHAVLESECTQATADTHASSMYTHVTARVHTHTSTKPTHPGRTQAPLGRRRGQRCQQGTYMYTYAHIRTHTSRSQTHDFHTHDC